MKKLILSCMIILFAVFAMLSVLTSGGEYAAEKLFYRAVKNNAQILKNPDVVPPALMASVEKDLKKLVSKYPNAIVTRTANLMLAEFYLSHKEYGKVRSVVNAMHGKYADDIMITSTAQFLKGVSYEREGNWPKALAEFDVLQDKYALTRVGNQLPLYIAEYYKSKGEVENMEAAYSRAKSIYEQMEEEYSGKNFGYVAYTFLVQTSLKSEDYEKAGQTIELALEKYPSLLTLQQFLPVSGEILG